MLQCSLGSGVSEVIVGGAKGGEFFTPLSIVKLIVEIIEPFNGRIYDPAWRLRGALRAVKRVAKLNLSFTPEYMLR